MSVVDLLRRNDPAIKFIHITLNDDDDGPDADLAQALEQNPFVTEIVLSLEWEQQRADWNSLLRVIATRANLEKVILEDVVIPTTERSARVSALVKSILQAIQQNTAIRSVAMRWLRLSTDISTFVDNASSITSFKLYKCDGEQGASSDLAAALQRNTNIERLELNNLKDICAIPILEGLRSNVSLKTFFFSPTFPFSGAASHALQHLLESTTSIQRVEWEYAYFSENQFRPIAQAIINSECVSALKFSRVGFHDGGSIAQLRSILLNKRNLTSLCLHKCYFVGGQVHEDIISILSRRDSLLRCFEYQGLHSLDREFPGIQFKNLLQEIQKSKLERFSIGSIDTPHQLQTLTQSVPLMRIRELEVAVAGQFRREDVNSRQDLLHAVKNNFSLRSVKGTMRDVDVDVASDLFERDEDKKTLAFYAKRNERLDQWVDNPEIVEQGKVWPEVLSLAQRAGPTALFRGLRSVLERDCVSLPGGRKRKRPQYYTPS